MGVCRFSLSFVATLGLFGALSGVALASQAELESFLKVFDEDSAKALNLRVVKKTLDGQLIPPTTGRFSAQDIATREFVTKRDLVRQKMCKLSGGAVVCLSDVLPGRAAISDGDKIEDLLDNPDQALRSLEAMEKKRLTEAKLHESPWSDDYWAIYKGIIAARYNDATFPASLDWQENKNYVSKAENNFSAIFETGNSSSIDNLSPAEKYDLLVGDSEGNLTKRMWLEGEKLNQQYGTVEPWMGICHGWAAASYMIPRPSSAITVKAADGRTKIRFYPSDIKALASLLWANAKTPANLAGGRCDDKDPKTDRSGRIVSDQCFDTNPGTWHVGVVNRIGVEKASFVIDATYDYEVWNQPVHSYSYSYFNPSTRKPVGSLKNATVKLSRFTNDKFKKFRSPEAEYVVGVSMEVAYVVETPPNHDTRDSASRDKLTVATYTYDLELNAAGEIIGGEWYNNAHPDFLWTPPAGTAAKSAGDRYLKGNWDGTSPIPAEWTTVAQRTSTYGQPLAKVINALVVMSKMGRSGSR